MSMNNPPETFGIFERRRFRITGGYFDNGWFAQQAGRNGVADFLVVVVKTADKAGLQFDAGLLDSIQSQVDFIDIKVDRFFAEKCPCQLLQPESSGQHGY